MAIYINRTGWPAASEQQLKDATEVSTAAVAKNWHSQTLPIHFTTGAVSRYGYKARTRAYMLSKANRRGHQRPLEWSGELSRQLKRSAQIQRTKGGVNLKMHGRALNFSGKVAKRKDGGAGATYPNMKSEVSEVTRDEEVALARIARKAATASLRQIRASKRTQAGSTTGGTTATV